MSPSEPGLERPCRECCGTILQLPACGRGLAVRRPADAGLLPGRLGAPQVAADVAHDDAMNGPTEVRVPPLSSPRVPTTDTERSVAR